MPDLRSERQLTAGVDVGSSSVKVAIVRSTAGDRAETLATAVERIRRRHLHRVVRETFQRACDQAGVATDAFDYIASTGDGDAVAFRSGHFYGMTTHARGAVHLVPEARAAVDIGALHARAIRFDRRGKVLGHRMTSQCASGSGQFLENIARYLGVPLEDVGALSVSASEPERVSSICAVLAETDVINMVSREISTPDILKGIHLSIAGRLAKLLRAVGAEGAVAITGGLVRDEGMIAALREELQSEKHLRRQRGGPVEVAAHEDGVFAGALGAALLAAYRYKQLEAAGRLNRAGISSAPPA